MKNNYKFIYKNENDYFVGEVRNKKLYRYINLSQQVKGNIYRARVKKYIKSLDAYIVDIGEEFDGILKTNKTIEKIKGGDVVIVEAYQNRNYEKMINLTQKITMTDGYIVIGDYINFKKSTEGPYLLRTKAKGFNKKDLDIRYEKLKVEYDKILKSKNVLPVPKIIKENNYLNEFFYEYDYDIISNYKNEYATIVDKNFNPNYIREIYFGINDINNKKIDFDGGNVVIEITEALTVIDINSSNKNMDLSKENMSFVTNNQSLSVISRLILLKNIKKMIVIDFIRMKNKDKEKLIENFTKILESEKIKFKIMGYSNMDLLEMIVF